MVKDFLGNELKAGDYFAYPLTAGRSANMAIFRYKDQLPSGAHRAFPVDRTYGKNTNKYKVFEYRPEGQSFYRDMTDEEKAKVDAKTSTLHFLEDKAVKLKGYKP